MKPKAPVGKPFVFYLCDMKKCENCSGKTHGECFHTSDKTHAKYKDDSQREFEQNGMFLFEKERGIHGSVR